MSDDDELTAVSEEERREAEALARALDRGGDPEPGSLGELAARVRAVKGARPAPLPAERRRAIVASAIESGRARRTRRALGAGLAIAAAALLAIGVGTLWPGGEEALSYGGPASGAFDAPFPEAQPSSERLDRLARARTRDYFAALVARGEAR